MKFLKSIFLSLACLVFVAQNVSAQKEVLSWSDIDTVNSGETLYLRPFNAANDTASGVIGDYSAYFSMLSDSLSGNPIVTNVIECSTKEPPFIWYPLTNGTLTSNGAAQQTFELRIDTKCPCAKLRWRSTAPATTQATKIQRQITIKRN
jgi:hypothetical protein